MSLVILGVVGRERQNNSVNCGHFLNEIAYISTIRLHADDDIFALCIDCKYIFNIKH